MHITYIRQLQRDSQACSQFLLGTSRMLL